MPKDPKLCTIDGCDRVRSSALYCQKHYRAFKLYGDPLKLKNNPVGGVCKHPGCDLKPRVRGLCDKHYSRLQRHGSSFETKSDPRDISLKKRIKRNIEIDENGCWIWQKGTTEDGYGQISVGGKKRRAHCLAYEEWIGDIPKGKEVCHTCDVRNCCNPKHLFIGTHKENVQDMVKKGRRSSTKGGNNPNSQLTESIVIRIVDMLISDVPDVEVAEEFGVSRTSISKIRRGVNWSHVIEELPEFKRRKLSKIKKKGQEPVKAFSKSDVLLIRRMLKKGHTIARIARKFVVGETTVRNLRDGKTYSDVY
jgi:hypothetical protein